MRTSVMRAAWGFGLAIALALGGPVGAQQNTEPPAPDEPSGQEPSPRPRLSGPPRFLDIDWESAREELRRTRAEGREVVLALAPRERLRQIRLPVLVPDLPEMRSGGRVFPSRDFYSATVTLPNAVLEIYGTRTATPLPEALAAAVARRAQPDSEGLRIQRNETGIEVSFQRFNASYNISLICSDPRQDQRCLAGSFIRDLAGRMAIAGGEPEEEE